MVEHYSEAQLGRTRRLYDTVKKWATDRGDVTIIGGWAVFEHVAGGHAMQSRDIDIVLHSEKALQDLNTKIVPWGLRWRTKGGKRFPDAHFEDEDELVFRLDVFTTEDNPTWKQRFGRQGAANVKACPKQASPSLTWLIEDKLKTVHLRKSAEAPDKRAKDLIDLYNLVFHNKSGLSPLTLADQGSANLRAKAIKWLDEAKLIRPQYEEEIDTLRQWLSQ